MYFRSIQFKGIIEEIDEERIRMYNSVAEEMYESFDSFLSIRGREMNVPQFPISTSLFLF